MRFGLFTSMGAQTWSGVLDLWRHVEATGWDIGCVTDHFMPNTKEREGAMLESWSTLTALAALVTLRIVAKHADHWNVWGGPRVLAKKGAILDDHCTAVGRDPKNITRSANMVLLITDKKDEIERLAESIAMRLGRHAADARDTCLAGSPDQIREQLHRLQAVGDRKSTRLNSSHLGISYAVFCLKKKKT